MFRFRGLPKPYSADESPVCTTLPDSISNLSTWHGHSEQCCLVKLHHLTLTRFPETIFKRCLLVDFHVVRGTLQATIQRVSPCTATYPWLESLPTRDAFPTRDESIESDLPLHLVPYNCANALTAEFWGCLDLELNSICTCSLRSCPPTISMQVLDQSRLLSHTPSV